MVFAALLAASCGGARGGAADAAGEAMPRDGSADASRALDAPRAVADAPPPVADAAPPEHFLVADYIDLSRIERISRFRSDIGHDFSDGTETCRSMKHYFQPYVGAEPWTTVRIFAPVSGHIVRTMPDSWGQQLWITPLSRPDAIVRLFHVTPAAGIAEGASVLAGQPLGLHASGETMSDVAVAFEGPAGEHLRSYFDLVSDDVFAGYHARGVPDRQAMIVSAAERDADPLECGADGAFASPGHLPSWLALSPP